MSVAVTAADRAFACGLTADEVYVGLASSIEGVDPLAADEYSAAVASLMVPCYEAPLGSEEQRVCFRVLHVALLALHRPLGMQANADRVMRDRIRRLRGGGWLGGALARARLPTPRAQHTPR
jgi:hypothetical protein